MIIKSANFVISNTDVKKCPNDGRLEYAFIGRSNVGKSSLVNMLTGRKELALTSQKPGKTILINHFLINEEWYLVDLPGYGYAKMSKSGRARLAQIIRGYINLSPDLAVLFVLIDSRHDIGKIDMDFLKELGESRIPFAIIFTKADKNGVNARNEQIEKNKRQILEFWEELPPVFVSSSLNGMGREEILDYIETVLKELDGMKQTDINNQ